jgi:hypothetical protein
LCAYGTGERASSAVCEYHAGHGDTKSSKLYGFSLAICVCLEYIAFQLCAGFQDQLKRNGKM